MDDWSFLGSGEEGNTQPRCGGGGKGMPSALIGQKTAGLSIVGGDWRLLQPTDWARGLPG